MLHYMLDADGNVISTTDVLEWARWYETHNEERIVAKTQVRDCEVSTVFLATDYNFFGKGAPILWETMIFGELPSYCGSEFSDYQARYSSKAAAQAGHDEVVARLNYLMKPVASRHITLDD